MQTRKFLLLAPLVLYLSMCLAQDSTQTERNLGLLPVSVGKTKMMLTGITWFGFQANLNDPNKNSVKNSFNDYGFSPLFLWKLSDKFFFESEIEINKGAMELEYAKLSYSANKYLTIGAGRMLSPFGAYGERWEPNHVERFANPPLKPDDTVLPDDTHLFYGAIMGIDARGMIPMGSARLNYAVYISNGPLLSKDEKGNPTGVIQYENLLEENNNNKEIGGRIGILPFSSSSLEIGFSAKHGIAGDIGNIAYENIGATAIAFDLSYVKTMPFLKSTVGFRGQYNKLNVDKANYFLTDSTTYTFDNKLTSYFAQLSIRPSMIDNDFVRRLEFLLRYNCLAAPKDAIWSVKDANGVGGDITRFDIGLDYWFSWRTGLRFAYEITSLPDGTKTRQFLARIATGL